MSALLSGQQLTLLRGDRCLFQDLDFSLRPGGVLLIEGPNGSGKTSLLRAIAGFIEFETGEVQWHGKPIRQQWQTFRSSTAWLSHRVGLKADLTIEQNLAFEAGMRAMQPARLPAVLATLGLESLSKLPLGVLSAGQQRRAALARVLLSSATLWMMDEPLTNLDAAGQSLVVESIGAHVAAGGACLAASHQPIDVGAETSRLVLE